MIYYGCKKEKGNEIEMVICSDDLKTMSVKELCNLREEALKEIKERREKEASEYTDELLSFIEKVEKNGFRILLEYNVAEKTICIYDPKIEEEEV